MRRLLLTILILVSFALMTSARPNWGSITDGWRTYHIEGSPDDNRWTFISYGSGDECSYYISLEGSDDKYVIRDVESEYPSLVLPKPYTAGDTVIYHPELGAFFFNAKGRLYASMRPENSQEDNIRQIDTMRIVAGYYTSGDEDQALCFRLNHDRQPVFQLDYGEEEPLSFEPDVVAGGRVYMHIVTPKRRWLLSFTEKGLDVYQAKALPNKKGYQPGKLFRRTRFDENLSSDNGYRFDYNMPIPFVDITDHYFTTGMIAALQAELEPVKDQSPYSFYYRLYGLWTRGRKG
ncbi:MAG: hypothetical protein K6A32_00455 [Bacteroidales bacterium]|nr:hypothetical protein [Bacteroidales bacterium]